MEETIDFDTARALPHKERTIGLRVRSEVPPFGGTWKRDGEDLVLIEPPTNLEKE
jgi:hypothetical protein